MLRKSDVFVVFVGDDANIHRGNLAMVMSDEVGEADVDEPMQTCTY